MSTAILQVKNWGNSLGVRLPANIANQLSLHANQQIKLSVEADHIILTPVKETLEEKLARFDAKLHGGEVMVTTDSVGSERF
jgi:antitoxin MazE